MERFERICRFGACWVPGDSRPRNLLRHLSWTRYPRPGLWRLVACRNLAPQFAVQYGLGNHLLSGEFRTNPALTMYCKEGGFHEIPASPGVGENFRPAQGEVLWVRHYWLHIHNGGSLASYQEIGVEGSMPAYVQPRSGTEKLDERSRRNQNVLPAS